MDDAADEVLRRELLADAKEAAEHVMLVDLGRNDVGRVAEYGSVEVAAFRQVELYSHVMHLVSSVKGRLREGLSPVDAFFAGFPAGTVSGAPKIRALELIHELEEAPRGVYGGAVGYFDDSGRIDTCLAVRTIVVRGGEAIVQGGAGIVADSDPAREFAECGHKTAALRAALGPTGPGVAAAPPRTGVAR
jgi:anthranilate synthase component 1